MTAAELHALPDGTPVIDNRRLPAGPLPCRIRHTQFSTLVVPDDKAWPHAAAVCGTDGQHVIAARVELAE